MHEDDWRQIDLLSGYLRPEISTAFGEIREVYRDAGGLIGFDRAYIREGLDDPLADAALTVGDLAAAGVRPCVSLESDFPQRPGIIADSFAFQAGHGVVFYGVTLRSHVLLAGVFVEDLRILTDQADGLEQLVASHSLLLVNWVRASILLPSQAGLH